VNVWVGLVEVYNESCNILFTIFLGHEIIHIHCPLLNGSIACDVRVVGSTLIVDLLVTKGQFSHSVTGTLKDDIGNCIPSPWVISIKASIWIQDTTSL